VLISVGGIGTIVAVTTICAFLVWVVFPLFGGGEVTGDHAAASPLAGEPAPLWVVSDEYRVLGYALLPDGSRPVFRQEDGKLLVRERPFGNEEPSAWSFDRETGEAAVGFPDGSVRLAWLGFQARFLDDDVGPEAIRALRPGDTVLFEDGLAERTPEGQVRLQRPASTVKAPIQLSDAKILLLDRSQVGSATVVAALDAAGTLSLHRVEETKNLMTDETTLDVRTGTIPYEAPASRGAPSRLFLTGAGDNVLLVWSDGYAIRFDCRDLDAPVEVERLDLMAAEGASITCATWLLGKTTLAVGDSTGAIRAWFRIKPDGATSFDGALLVEAHVLEGSGSPVASLAPSVRRRLLVAGYADGAVRCFHVTSQEELAVADARGGGAVTAVAIGPKEDGLLATTAEKIHRWGFDAPHPEASLGALFGKVWYEGYAKPEHAWQSTSGTDDFEPKLGLVPLVFGTIKATFYSMLFAVPIALLAAIFTSEFLNPRVRTPVKSAIEMMASLPSVVLGFLAALVIAPFVQNVVMTVLASFATIPFLLLLGAYLWQLLPQGVSLRLSGWPRFALIASAFPLGLVLASLLAPALEQVLFAGSFVTWLDGHVGSAAGGWFIFLLPATALVVAIVVARVLGPWVRAVSVNWDRRACACADLGKFLAGTTAAIVLAGGLALGLSALGADPRGSLVGTYVQKNSLVVGFVMGFAVVPIIYTLAEDALSSVPQHLRLGSLAAGATPWQTATRIVVPTAMSGLFSAVMIGLGRAVGETMIVLMATGNTSIMDVNWFNGFRTLAANIATEMPEAVRDSTHYRVLFLAALALFAMTFVLNTVAETVRLRFRRRAFQL
jgi:phosphate transport system permease protein